MTAGLVANVAR